MGWKKKKTRDADKSAERDKKSEEDRGTSGRLSMRERCAVENPRYTAFYKAHSIVPETEWSQMMDTFRCALPTSFRLSGLNPHETRLMRHLVMSRFFPAIEAAEVTPEEAEEVDTKPHKLMWYPGDIAWQIQIPRHVVRKHPEFADFKKFLIASADRGMMVRQEAVSMVPPLFMDIEPHHRVLDLCAAPGSKTGQMIEALHAQEALTGETPTGIVLGNDSNNKRCYLLVHHMKRLDSPTFLVTNHDASAFPTIYSTDPSFPLKRGRPFLFDRILCDVPCSGDGTMRKNPNIWTDWTLSSSISLHNLQLRILVRGLELLKVGGRLVYSTCSLCPIEDEAVLCAALQRFEGSVELVDVSGSLPELRRESGLFTWKIFNDDVTEEYATFQDTPENHRGGKYQKSMFPPDQETTQRLHLNRAMRVLPHHQNTGGFFVAVLTKTAPIGVADKALFESESLADPEAAKAVEQAAEEEAEKHLKIADNKRNHGGVYREEPFLLADRDSAEITAFRNLFGVGDNFPFGNLMCRSDASRKRAFYLVSDAVKEVLQARNLEQLQLVNAGVRVFSLITHAETGLRLGGEGIRVAARFATRRVVRVTDPSDIELLITKEQVKLAEMSEGTVAQVDRSNPGSVVLELHSPVPETCPGADRTVVLPMPGWMGTDTLNIQVPKVERPALGLTLFGRWVDYVGQMPLKRKNKDGTREDDGDALDGQADQEHCEDANDNDAQADTASVAKKPRIVAESSSSTNDEAGPSTAQ